MVNNLSLLFMYAMGCEELQALYIVGVCAANSGQAKSVSVESDT